MNRYTLYCTAEQTKKALELGAPIKRSRYPVMSYEKSKYYKDENNFSWLIPTAEQMIMWLEEQHILIDFESNWEKNTIYTIFYKTEKEFIEQGFKPSRKETALAIIDASLDYLINQKSK